MSQLTTTVPVAHRRKGDSRTINTSERANLWSRIRPDRSRILLTYALFNIENLLRMAEPVFLGWAINDLLQSRTRGVWTFAVVHGIALTIGFVRQRYDTRLYSRLYTRIVSGVVVDQLARNIEPSRVLARSTLCREIVEFFERYLPIVTQTTYTLIGAIVMLAWYDAGTIAFCLGLFIPAAVVSWRHGRRTSALNGGLHDELERQASAIQSRNEHEIRLHFERLGRNRVAVSDAVAGNFAALGGTSLLFLVGLLMFVCRAPGAFAGDILAILRYGWMFVLGLEQLPHLIEQAARLRDIACRVSTGAAA